MDLSIAEHISLDSGAWRVIDPHNQESLDNSYTYELLPFNIPPQRRILASTLEYIEYDTNTYAIVCLRSTWARIGLLAPPTIIDPGFKGYLTMELFNANLSPVIIRPGDYIWNLFEITTTHPSHAPYTGRYQDQPFGVRSPLALDMVNTIGLAQRAQRSTEETTTKMQARIAELQEKFAADTLTESEARELTELREYASTH